MDASTAASSPVPDSEMAQERARRRQFWVALFCVCLTGAGNSAMGAVLPPLARELGISAAAVGAVGGLAPLVFILAAPFWGHTADRAGPRVVLAAGMAGYLIGAVAFVASAAAGLGLWISGYTALAVLGVGRVVNGALGAGTYPAAVSTAASTMPGDRRTSAIASIGAAYGVGMMIGPAIAATLSSFSLFAPYLVIGAVSLVAMVLVLVFTPSRVVPGGRKPGRILRPTDARIRPFLLITGGLFAIVASLGIVLGFSVMDRLHLDAAAAARTTGIVFTALGLFSLLAQLVLTRVKFRVPGHAMLLGSVCIIAGLVALTLAGGLPAFVAACGAIGFGLGLCGPATSAACSLALPVEEQGGGAGWMSSARSVGSIIGAWSAGALYAVGPLLPCATGAAIAALVAALVVLHPRIPLRTHR